MNRSPLSVFQTGSTNHNDLFSIMAEWESPSNIALVKYWGKKPGQFPANPSLSMTLSKAVSRTSVEAIATVEDKNQLTVNGNPDHLFVPKLQKLITWLISEIPILERYSFQIKTANTFPHSTGIASSASGVSAFSLCLLTIILKITGKELPENEFFRIASFISRLGSGSASRSVYGGFSLWGETPLVPDSSDLYAVAINDRVQADFYETARCDPCCFFYTEKFIQHAGHELMNTHPFAAGRIDQARTNIQATLSALQSGDFDKLAAIAENEALTLHSLIMTSPGGTILMEPNSLLILKRIQQARKQGLPVFFTLDAGPNVHLLYPDSDSEHVETFIREELTQFCESGKVIFDKCGDGPARIKTE